VVSVYVPQIAVRLDHVADAALQLLGLGEAAVYLAVPEGALLDREAGVCGL
jgi:hypothetical protein